jgi:hypothetical protein
LWAKKWQADRQPTSIKQHRQLHPTCPVHLQASPFAFKTMINNTQRQSPINPCTHKAALSNFIKDKNLKKKG